MKPTKTHWLSLSVGMLLAALPACKDAADHPHDDHAGHAHHDHDDHAHEGKNANHAGHDHGSHEDHDSHAGHDHAPAKPAGTSAAHDDHDQSITITPAAIKQWHITLERATTQPLTQTLRVPARVSYNLEKVAHVGSLVQGRVSAIHARVGDEVSPGDLLLELTSPQLGQAQSDLLQKQAGVRAARTTLKADTTQYENAKALHDKTQGIALSEVQRREAQMHASQAALDAATSDVAAARNQLMLMGMTDTAIDQLQETGKLDPIARIHAPIAGRVIQQRVTLGEAVSPERDALFILAAMDELWVLADVPEAHASHITQGAAATIHLPSQTRSMQGQVTFLHSELDEVTRTLTARIVMGTTGESDAARLRPGMFVQVDIRVGDDAAPVLAIPEKAVQTLDDKPVVFVPVQGQANTFKAQPVRIGKQVGELVPVLEGLREGQMFVATGSFILKADLGKAGAAHEH